ncbi:MAG: BLUF domain-containing protein [Solirubrobacteraceae bacterium]
MLRLIYMSKATDGLSNDDFSQILAEARERNRQFAVTGALCYRNGYFAQILEGPEPAVREIYAKIGRDERHSEPVIVKEEQTTKRLYEGWLMRGIDDQTAITAADELIALKGLADRDDTPDLMRRWLRLLQSSSRPVWAAEWMASKQSVLTFREHLERSGRPART